MRRYCKYSDALDCSECNEPICPCQDDPEAEREDEDEEPAFCGLERFNDRYFYD